MKLLIAVACLFLVGASKPGGAPAAGPCDEAQSTVEIRACLRAELATAEGELAALLEKIRLSGPEKEVQVLLEKSQAAWRSFVEAECNGLTAELWKGGTLMPAMVTDCRATLVRERTGSLKRAFFDLEQSSVEE